MYGDGCCIFAIQSFFPIIVVAFIFRSLCGFSRHFSLFGVPKELLIKEDALT
jgi:hypothetical protein